MKHLKRKLPPLTSLVAFEAASRLGGFTAAAEELNVSREAVSRQIRALESYLGVSLFERDANRAQLGPLGERLFGTVSPNLWAIATAAQELVGEVSPDKRDLPTDVLDNQQDNDMPTLLIVDDIVANIHQLHGLLKRDYRVVAQTSGREALEYLSAASVDLILLDARMPEMDGYEFCKKLKSTASLSDIPVIFVTSLDDPADETRGLEYGASDFLTRPVVPAVMHARIRNQIELRQSRQALDSLLRRRADRLKRAEDIIARISSEIERLHSS